MKRSILFIFLIAILMFSVYAVSDGDDGTVTSFSSVTPEENVSDNMRAEDTINAVPSNALSENSLMDPAPCIQQEMADKKELKDFLPANPPETTGVLRIQEYVTPYADAVQDYLKDEDLDDADEIYETAVSWIWVSDTTLNYQPDGWLTPTEFLQDTPDFDSNPVPGEIVSDCTEQANTLASLLIGSGEYDEETLRVVMGQVTSSNINGGHAWVEVYEDGEWFPVDATVGPYYDEDLEEVVYPDNYKDIDFDYFRDEKYSVVELWYYYNNEYIIDVSSGTGDAPDYWYSIPSSYY
ncbi:transglutaminase domain-containing protein [Methanolobus sediminis]|uniref:Transglutaminase domain-containing protein n=1 Tax=Methanolobus sediminis TaxID=3072978 RepID=A0AA51UMK9_9EURY|nr:transglutaminase domain-containing protein [Methanolobus sediminis]WMW26027.1 transglutaminase domain-containing protein [Methanolobus sediminis]